MRTGQAPDLSLKTTIRDLQSLGLLIDPNEESAWANGLDIDQMMVATPARPETTTTETNPLDNEVDGEASNTEADTANADTNNPLDNEVEGDAPDGDSANLDEPNLLGASRKPTSARIDESVRIDERVRVDERANGEDPGKGGLAENQPQVQQMRGGGRDRPCRVKKPVSKFA